MLKKIFVVSMVLLALLGVACIRFPVALAGSTSSGWVFFYDNFEGDAVDSAKWNTDIATSGVRWHSSTDDPELAHTSPGNWEEPPVSPPYGSIAVADSIVSFKDIDTPSQVFPYIWTGPPSRPSPFPETGDFILEVRMKYDRASTHGCGIKIVGWANSDPVGDNPPQPEGQIFGGIWRDMVYSWPEALNDLNWHTFKLTYVGGEYRFFMDNSLVYGPVTSILRPNTIWIGNPLFVHWGAADWSRFSIDFVRVTATEWPMFRHDPARTGTTAEGVTPPLTLLWKSTIVGAQVVGSSPAVSGGVVYVGGGGAYGRNVYALNAHTGEEIWVYETARVDSSPAVSGGVVYVGSGNGKVYALNATTGALIWSYNTLGAVDSSPAVVDEVVYVGSNDDCIYALDAITGEEIWFYRTGGDVTSSPAISNGIVYVGAHWNVFALNATTGKKIWNYTEVGWGHVYSSPAIVDGIVYIGGGRGGYGEDVYALNATTGEKIWRYDTGAMKSSPAVSNGVVYIGSWDHYVYAINSTTGEQIWKYETDTIDSSPAVSGDVVYIGTRDYRIYAINTTTGEMLWSYKTGGYVMSSPAVSNGVVYVGSDDGNVYAFVREDDNPPVIGSPSREPSDEVMPDQDVKVLVSVIDAETGVKNVTLFYTTDTSWNNLSMTYNLTTGLYEVIVPRQLYCTWVKYKIIAYDTVENQAVNDNTGEYFVYHVIPEFPSAMILPLFLTISMLAAILVRRRLAGKQE